MKQLLLFTKDTEDVEEETRPLIQSISYSQDTILSSIIHLHVPAGKIQVDPCYNQGCFYKSGIVPEPDYIFDINPLSPQVQKADCRKLPFADNTIHSLVFDPPWITYPGKNICKNLRKYGSFRTYNDLKKMYRASFKEFSRILKSGGILVVKCQDGTYGPHLTLTHIDDVILPCRELGFREIDLFILISKGRIERRDVIQRHSRKYHCYFIVFQNKEK